MKISRHALGLPWVQSIFGWVFVSREAQAASVRALSRSTGPLKFRSEHFQLFMP